MLKLHLCSLCIYSGTPAYGMKSPHLGQIFPLHHNLDVSSLGILTITIYLLEKNLSVIISRQKSLTYSPKFDWNSTPCHPTSMTVELLRAWKQVETPIARDLYGERAWYIVGFNKFYWMVEWINELKNWRESSLSGHSMWLGLSKSLKTTPCVTIRTRIVLQAAIRELSVVLDDLLVPPQGLLSCATSETPALASGNHSTPVSNASSHMTPSWDWSVTRSIKVLA